ncbi:MAG: hypothetical protein COU47_03475 [Candidatus Niyogibacteria bacterium CG10_big_fil_rev_8_21_14_0_10_46_36]|uniref:Serine protease n=1 Tax=Candidatus Niyogibacteria bacterium CG10_big_fil_rev_8_21_14_0_10_46_36 TaxID=1974726 RepID=A0A2H0TEL9_9BACT|nr:MAG: hypothetical protein COU47_03475 [Candidatus Niyogibacteria bacterium CG10_big_fil_rev_8_21_14_0_10_46_36]
MSVFKQHGVTIGLVCVTLLALLFAYQGRTGAKNALLELEHISLALTGRIADLDALIEMQGYQIRSLREEGFIEGDSFPAHAETVSRATVIIIDEGSDIGSGFFIDSGGVIVTAAHVIDAAGDGFQVQTYDGRTFAGKTIAKDSSVDIALVRIAGEDFPSVALGYFQNIEIGEEIGIAGFNRGLSRILVHRGVVSSKDEEGGTKQISINAFVNKGNSGGPIFSALTGRVIGMVQARQIDIPSEKLIILPPNYSSGFAIGGLDPVKFNVELYNETVALVGDVSQVGIGFGVASEHIRALEQKIK